jgi:argininosuccinate lyase
VFELTRARCNKLQTLPYQINAVINNLPSGYFRDFQLLKEQFIPSFGELKDCLVMTNAIMSSMEINTHILDDKKYDHLFSVEVVNKLVLEGVPFRDAYKQVGLAIENGSFTPDTAINHTHEGSLGNLCNDAILNRKAAISASFGFERVESAESSLLGH